MKEEKSTPEITADDESVLGKDAKKRFSYPSKPLKEIIEFVGKVYNQLGHTTFLSNEAIATVHGFSPGSIKPHLSSAQQYKIFELKYGTGYKVTEHFQKLFLPKNETEKRASVIESLKNVQAYQQLFKDYEYHIVPAEGVKNHFIRSFSFKDDIALKAAEIFIDNLRDFGLIDGRGVLTSALQLKAVVPEVVDEAQHDVNKTNPQTNVEQNNGNNVPTVNQPSNKFIFQSEIEAAGKKTIPIYLIGTKQALFVYPDDISEDDIELVQHQIAGILLRIKLEAKARAKGTKQPESIGDVAGAK